MAFASCTGIDLTASVNSFFTPVRLVLTRG